MTNRQREELAKFCFDLSKLSLGSWVFGLFTAGVGIPQTIYAVAGLTLAALFFILGMRLFKEVI